jgi:hypothetical protein
MFFLVFKDQDMLLSIKKNASICASLYIYKIKDKVCLLNTKITNERQ